MWSCGLAPRPSDEVSIEDAKKLIADGVIRQDTNLWTEGMEEWTGFIECCDKFGLGGPSSPIQSKLDMILPDGMPPRGGVVLS